MTTHDLALVATLALVALGLTFMAAGWLAWKLTAIRRRFAQVIDVDAELRRVEDAIEMVERRRNALLASYGKDKATYERLQRDLSLLEENIEDISFGLYKPHYEFATSAAYKAKLDDVYLQKKALIRNNDAIRFAIEWTVGGSKKDGARMQKQYGKLLLRAFNAECDAATVKVAWNNVTRMEERIGKAYTAINEMGTVMQISITAKYLDLRMQELFLFHEMAERKQAEAEEQRKIREEMREEERVRQQLEKEQKEAEAEEIRYQTALDKARAEISRATGTERERLNARVTELQRLLEEAHTKKDKAISQAQLTKAGHVYVISNVGSFGDNIFKIGMTRRLEPMERVKELGDASVPFEFDVHALVYTMDAPALETAIHRRFDHRRVNLVNPRKEFFHVELHELEEFVCTLNLQIELTKLAEAREYRQTIAMREAAAVSKEKTVSVQPSGYPAQLLATDK